MDGSNGSATALGNSLRQTEAELEQIHEQLDEALENRDDLIKQLSRERQEAANWKHKYENEALGTIGDLEDQR